MNARRAGESIESLVAPSGARIRQPSTSSSLADLTACVRRTTGDRPPPLVGCSITLVGDSVYVFGGRLVQARTMLSSVYQLSLKTLEWKRKWPPKGIDEHDFNNTAGLKSPTARYFHSAECWGTKIVIFGGEGYARQLETEESPRDPQLVTLGDLALWDTVENHWEFPEIGCEEGVTPPEPRYAHLSLICQAAEDVEVRETRPRMVHNERSLFVVLGGQNIQNVYLNSMCCLDLDTMRWVKTSKWERHIGSYRAVVTTPKHTVVPGVSPGKTVSNNSNFFQHYGKGPESYAYDLAKAEKDLVQLSYSASPTLSNPEPFLLFSNFNFTQVRRDLDIVLSPLSPQNPLERNALSSLMAGAHLPPGLRFPTGTIVGKHLLLFGTYLSHIVNTFCIWALDLGASGISGAVEMAKRGEPLNWIKVDPGSTLAKGSWNKALCWKNSVVVLGDRERDIGKDYDCRQTNFLHVAYIDLEAFGIYQPPPRPLPPSAQALGLFTLSQKCLTDFEIICSDGNRLACSRRLLEERWKWFRERMIEFRDRAKGILAASNRRYENPRPEAEEQQPTQLSASSSNKTQSGPKNWNTARELRLTPRTLNIPEPSAVVLGFLQFLYTMTLCTSLQLSLPVLSGLLVFSKTYEEPNLRALVAHCLHEALSSGAWTTATVYEAATLGGCTALQLRALRLMLQSSKSNPTRKSTDPTDGSAQPGRHDSVSSGPPERYFYHINNGNVISNRSATFTAVHPGTTRNAPLAPHLLITNPPPHAEGEGDKSPLQISPFSSPTLSSATSNASNLSKRGSPIADGGESVVVSRGSLETQGLNSPRSISTSLSTTTTDSLFTGDSRASSESSRLSLLNGKEARITPELSPIKEGLIETSEEMGKPQLALSLEGFLTPHLTPEILLTPVNEGSAGAKEASLKEECDTPTLGETKESRGWHVPGFFHRPKILGEEKLITLSDSGNGLHTMTERQNSGDGSQSTEDVFVDVEDSILLTSPSSPKKTRRDSITGSESSAHGRQSIGHSPISEFESLPKQLVAGHDRLLRPRHLLGTSELKERSDLELRIGTHILQNSGATAKDIALNARNEGWRVLKEHEEQRQVSHDERAAHRWSFWKKKT